MGGNVQERSCQMRWFAAGGTGQMGKHHVVAPDSHSFPIQRRFLPIGHVWRRCGAFTHPKVGRQGGCKGGVRKVWEDGTRKHVTSW